MYEKKKFKYQNHSYNNFFDRNIYKQKNFRTNQKEKKTK